MKASIIILNWNGGEADCAAAVESAMAQSYPNKEIIFVDNGSSDGSGEIIRARFPDLIYVPLPENIGCPPGRNVGAKYAGGDLLFFLENDGVWDDSELVASAIQLFNERPTLGAAYTRVEGYETGEIDPPLDPKPSKKASRGLYLSSSFRGGASIIRAAVFADCGGFPNDFFRQCEERFLSLVIYEKRYKVAYWPEYSLRHKGSDYSGKAVTVSKYNVENNLKTIIRLYPLAPAILVGVPKWISGAVSLLKAGYIAEFKTVTVNLLKEIGNRSDYRRIKKASFREVETLRQGQSAEIEFGEKIDVKPLTVLLFRRLFMRG